MIFYFNIFRKRKEKIRIYPNVTKTVILPVPFANGSKALPTNAPKHFSMSVHFIAWPEVFEVVSKLS